MGVKLSEFAKRLVLERGLIRKNKGPSIVPLLIVHFTNNGILSNENPHNTPILITVDQKTGGLFRHKDLTKWYSMGKWDYDNRDWLGCIDVVSLRLPVGIRTSRILQISAQVNRELTNEYNGW